MYSKKTEGKTLILVTKRFPFFKTEAFLESEIEILASHFKKIIIFPYEISNESRNVPVNVEVDISFSSVYKRKKLRALITFFSPFFWKTIYLHKFNLKRFKDFSMILKFCSNFLVYLYFFRKLKFIENVDLVYTYWFNESTLSFLKLRSRLFLDFKVVTRAHRFDVYEGNSADVRFWPYRKYCLENLDKIFCISNDGKSYLERKYNTSKNLVVSKLGVPDRFFSIKSKSRDNAIRIVSVSRIVTMKRVDLIMKSVALFASRHPKRSVYWDHFGDGPGLESIKNNSVFQSNLEINFKGYVSNSDIYSYYQSFSVNLFVNLSSSEGIPVSIMEAISFGIPIVATDVGGNREIVSSANGVLLDPNPTVLQVAIAFEHVIDSGIFEPYTIRNFWEKNFSAENNYNVFSKNLIRLCE